MLPSDERKTGSYRFSVKECWCNKIVGQLELTVQHVERRVSDKSWLITHNLAHSLLERRLLVVLYLKASCIQFQCDKRTKKKKGEGETSERIQKRKKYIKKNSLRKRNFIAR